MATDFNAEYLKMISVYFATLKEATIVFIKTEDTRETKRQFQRRITNRNAPSLRTTRRNCHEYKTYCTSENRHKAMSARKPLNIAAIQREIQRNHSVTVH